MGRMTMKEYHYDPHYMRLHSGDPEKQYLMPDPDAVQDIYYAARHKFYPLTGEPRALTAEERMVVTMLAEAYLHLTTYSLGQECCVQKLRDVWRARKKRFTNNA